MQPVNAVRPARTAELIADALRAEILNRTIVDQLPVEDQLRERFGVGKSSMREALVILESEGLITVRRGKVGGSDVHLPTAASAAYTLSLVLAAEEVTLGNLADALRLLEPQCAQLCAARSDRAAEVVPRLHELNEEMEAALDDGPEAIAASRRFHEAIVELCGNGALSVITGALERLWSAHEHQWASEKVDANDFPSMDARARALQWHRDVADLIEAGDPRVGEVLADHLGEAQIHTSADRSEARIDITPLRSTAATRIDARSAL